MVHDGELSVDVRLAHRLISEQFPEYRDLPLHSLRATGTAHTMFRLGRSYVARFPRLPEFGLALLRESEILTRLRPFLPLPIPELVGLGEGTDLYQSPWSLLRWIEASPIDDVGEVGTSTEIAQSLGRFVVAMRSIRLPGANSTNIRGQPLAANDEFARTSIEAIGDIFDAAHLEAIWDEALAAPPWDGMRAWIHGDLLPGNLLLQNGRLAAVIDFGECSVGNPTYDLVAAWWVFDGPSRVAFREAVEVAEDEWDRARGWALSGAAGALSYYRDSLPGFAATAKRTLRRVLADS